MSYRKIARSQELFAGKKFKKGAKDIFIQISGSVILKKRN